MFCFVEVRVFEHDRLDAQKALEIAQGGLSEPFRIRWVPWVYRPSLRISGPAIALYLFPLFCSIVVRLTEAL